MDKVLVITGGSRGIGKETIVEFQSHHWTAINIARTNCDLSDVINLNIDLSNPLWNENIDPRLISTLEQASQICLVHNAAVFNSESIANLNANDLRQVIEFNVIAPAILNTLIIPYMKKQSSIIYIGSTLSEIGVPNRASYVITKHALAGMMRATTQDLANTGIHTCCICPGFVNTSMLTNQVDKAALDAIIKQKVTAQRLIEPDEIARFIYFCSQNPIINGSVLHANLGQTT